MWTLILTPPEPDIPTLKALEPKVHTIVGLTPSFEHLFFNLGITNSAIKDASGNVIGNSDVAGFCPFQDVNVRKAFMLATDRDTIAKTLLYGAVTVPASLWQTHMVRYKPNSLSI